MISSITSMNYLDPRVAKVGVTGSQPLDLKGHIKISLVYPDRTEIHLEEDNLIVYGGRQLILAPLYLSGRTSDPIATLRVGTGGTIDSGGVFPKTPAQSQSALYNQLLSTSTTYTYDSSRPAVTFLADIPETDGNGNLINEAGMFTTSGVMFNIKTFGGIPKTSAFSIHFEWTVAVV